MGGSVRRAKIRGEGQVDARRLNAKYAPALDGATIGVQKTALNGDTVYALRVGGLSKAEAAALCERVKGHDCILGEVKTAVMQADYDQIGAANPGSPPPGWSWRNLWCVPPKIAGAPGNHRFSMKAATV